MKVYAFSTLLYRMVFFLVVNALVLNGILWAVSPVGFKEIVLPNVWDFFYGKCGRLMGGDVRAYDYVQRPHKTPLYTEVFFNRKVKFQYPPSALFAIAAIRMAGVERVRAANDLFGWAWPDPGLAQLVRAANILGWMFILVMIISVAALLHIQFQEITFLSENRSSFALCASLRPVSL